MANLFEIANWETGIYQLEPTDLVIGGASGVSNRQGRQLANRTTWLKSQLGLMTAYTDVQVISSSLTLGPASVGNVVVVDCNNATLTVALPRLSGINPYVGKFVTIIAVNVNKSQLTVTAPFNLIGYGSTGNRGAMFMGDGDCLTFVAPPFTGTMVAWQLAHVKGNFDDAGEVCYSYKTLPNTVHANGQILSRNDYPRLWEFVSGIGGGMVSDAQWLAGSGGVAGADTYKGCFSSGNGSTTFRVPDLRAMFLRGLDNGRGIDLGRFYNQPGGYEKDEVIAHNHTNATFNQLLQSTGIYTASVGGDSSPNEPDIFHSAPMNAYGGAETRPKNVGLLPLIKV